MARKPKRKVRRYRGINIYPAERNSSGIRWYAHNPSPNGPRFLRADTLDSMRALINGIYPNEL